MGKQGEFSAAMIGSAKHIRVVEKQIQEIILSNVHKSNLVTELAEYLRSVFGVDFCLLCPYPQGNGILVTSQDCSLYSRAELLPWLEQPEFLAKPENPDEIVAIANLDHQAGNQVRNQDQLSLPTPLQSLASLLKVNIPGGGVILLGSHQPRKLWTKGEKNLLQALVSIVAIALQQSQVEQKLSLSYSYQKLVNQITQAIRDHEEISQILQQAITATAQTLEASAGTILLLKYKEPAWKKLEAKFQGTAKTNVAAQWKTPGYQQQLLPAQPVFWLSSSPLCSQALHQAPQPLILQATPGLVMFPLLGTAGNALSSRVLGFLALEYDSARQLLEGELELIHSVSNQISYALIQDQTLRQVRAIVDKRTAQLQASLEVQGRLYEKIRHQVDQLRQLNQIKDEFISAISHELRTPLTSMTLAIRMLREEDLPPDRQAKYLEVLAQQCQQEVLLINDLLALQQLEEKLALN
jgi:GAF domain-containing protein